ncbi:ATP synthase F1 subunit delta [bacterium]|nr:ATP synthase F1 subunit delta [bacterium]
MAEQDIPILETYAEALLQAARPELLDDLSDAARSLGRVLAEHPSLKRFLGEPALEVTAKHDLLRKVFEGRIPKLLMNLALLLVDKHRGGLWGGVLERYVAMVDEKRGIFEGRVTTAYVLEEDLKDRLHQSLESFTGKKLRMEYMTDPNLIGGVLFRAGDMMIDSTIRGYMKDLRWRLRQVRVESTRESAS